MVVLSGLLTPLEWFLQDWSQVLSCFCATKFLIGFSLLGLVVILCVSDCKWFSGYGNVGKAWQKQEVLMLFCEYQGSRVEAASMANARTKTTKTSKETTGECRQSEHSSHFKAQLSRMHKPQHPKRLVKVQTSSEILPKESTLGHHVEATKWRSYLRSDIGDVWRLCRHFLKIQGLHSSGCPLVPSTKLWCLIESVSSSGVHQAWGIFRALVIQRYWNKKTGKKNNYNNSLKNFGIWLETQRISSNLDGFQWSRGASIAQHPS